MAMKDWWALIFFMLWWPYGTKNPGRRAAAALLQVGRGVAGRRDGGDAIAVGRAARRRREFNVQRMPHVPAFGQEEAGDDWQVS